MKKRVTRFDSLPLPPSMQHPVTPADAERFLTDADGSTTAARLKMLARAGLATEEHTAAEARKRMIQRRNRKENMS